MNTWTRDLQLAFRALLRTPGFAVLTVVMLGLAIGANAGIFSVVDTVLLDPLPYADTDRLVYIAASAPGSDFPEEFPVAAEFLLQYREKSELLEVLARQLPERFGGPANYARLIEQHRAVVRPLEQQLLGTVSGPLWILLAAMAIVLIIACANVANLFMVRAERRQPDLAVQRALGASRGRLILSQLAEAAVVAGLAGMLAVALARAGVPLLLAAAPANIPRLAEVAIGIASLLALILGVVGLYGVLSYAVAERTREIGVRMALGAAARRVQLMIVRQGARVLAAGIVLGVAIALMATKALGTLLYGVEAFDVTTYLGVSALMVLVGLAASYLPARRASSVDPMVSLRTE